MSNTPPHRILDALLCYNVYALNLAFGRYYQTAFGDTGFTYPKFLVLLALRDAGPMSLSDLSKQIGVEANTLSPLVKRMSDFGLMDRVRDPRDERKVLLTLKPFGKNVLEEAFTVADAGWNDLNLTQEEVETANTILIKIRGRLESTPPSQIMALPERPEGEN